jgi:C4-dicarboxylate-specific signal transduction histidine kinase
MNDLAVKALHALDSELRSHKVTTRIQLASQLPPIMGHGGQLQEVLVNLIQNAIDAMASSDDGRRILQVRTEHNGDAISVDIVDTGPGIDPKKSDNIFDAFFTTKPNGMGHPEAMKPRAIPITSSSKLLEVKPTKVAA